jgi:hypothetical protein
MPPTYSHRATKRESKDANSADPGATATAQEWGDWALTFLLLPRGAVAALESAHMAEDVLEAVWHDFQLQDQHTGGKAAPCAAWKWSGATVWEPACSRDFLQRYGQVPEPPLPAHQRLGLCYWGQGSLNGT